MRAIVIVLALTVSCGSDCYMREDGMDAACEREYGSRRCHAISPGEEDPCMPFPCGADGFCSVVRCESDDDCGLAECAHLIFPRHYCVLGDAE